MTETKNETKTARARREHERQELVAKARQAERTTARRRRILKIGLSAVAVVVVGGLITFGLLSARPEQVDQTRVAPTFALPTSDGASVDLADYAGKPVILYFNEGAGCDSCLVQMAQIENDPAFADAGITVLPIVMNTADQINADRVRLGVKTPFLLDDGTVSAQYDVLGTGMHEGLPGHGFVLIDENGTQLWQGNYPSMWLEPSELLAKATDLLAK